jgi:hypothetical protein
MFYAVNFDPFAKYSDETAYNSDLVILTHPEDVFKKNDTELRKDFKLLTKGRKSAKLSSTNTIIGTDFFAEEGAQADCCSFQHH